MAQFDINAIRAKLAQLNGERKQTGQNEIQYWKPTLREDPYRIRIIPWKGRDPSEPFIERSFYFLPNQKGFVAPSSLGKPDPVADLRMKLFQAKDTANAKLLFPKQYAYAKVIVRGEEDQGVKIWKFTNHVQKRLLGFFVDEDGGDITDLENGFDLKVKVTQVPNKTYSDTTIDLGKQGPASKGNDKQAAEWYDKKIDIDDLHRHMFKESHEIEAIIDNWLNGGEVSEGTSKGKQDDEKGDALDNLTRELGVTSKPEKVIPKPVEVKKSAPAPKVVHENNIDEEDLTPAKISLDEAFDDLLNE